MRWQLKWEELLKILALTDAYDSGKYVYEGKRVKYSMDRVVLSSHDRNSFFNSMERNECQIVKL